eukprot:4999271-Heterocapsa_arctica.AAC.1
MDWLSSAHWLNRAIKYSTAAAANSTATELDPGADGPIPSSIEVVEIWSQTVPKACAECSAAARAPRSVARGRVWNIPTADRRPRRPRLLATASASSPADSIIACMIASVPQAAWPLAGKGWWPSPRIMQDGTANAKWVCSTCCVCRCSRALLVATTAIPAGAELTVPEANQILGASGNEPATQVAFDGGAKDGVSGAGAVLWIRQKNCHWQVAATTSIALPASGHPQVAEAWGLKLAIQLII